MSRIAFGVAVAEPIEELLRQNLEFLMGQRNMTQAGLAVLIGKSQSWVSKRLSGKPQPHGARLQVGDLDMLAAVFGLSPSDLLLPGYGKRDRRSGQDRRCRPDRRTRRAGES